MNPGRLPLSNLRQREEATMNHSSNLLLNFAGGCVLVCGLTIPAALWAQGIHVGGEGGPSVDIDREGGISASAGEGGPSAHVGSDGISASAGGEGGASAEVGEGGISANGGEGGGSVEIGSDGTINVIPPPPEEPDNGEEEPPTGEQPEG